VPKVAPVVPAVGPGVQAVGPGEPRAEALGEPRAEALGEVPSAAAVREEGLLVEQAPVDLIGEAEAPVGRPEEADPPV
jgi:hypothetical protein